MSNWSNNRDSGRNNRPRQDDYRRDEGRQSFPNSGALFPNNNKRSDNSPDMTGNVVISEDVLDYILREAERGNEVKLDLSGWRRMSRDNNSFTSIKIAIPYAVRMEQGGGNQNYQARPAPPRNRERDDDRVDPQGNRYPQPQRRSPSYSEASGRSERGGYSERNPPPNKDDMPDYLREDDSDAPPF